MHRVSPFESVSVIRKGLSISWKAMKRRMDQILDDVDCEKDVCVGDEVVVQVLDGSEAVDICVYDEDGVGDEADSRVDPR